MIEWVYVALDDEEVVVSDNGATFASIAGHQGDDDEYVEWSPDRALAPAQRFGVTLVDETDRDQEGNILATAWPLARRVHPGESVAEVVQAMAQAIDGVFAVHVRPDAVTRGSYFWDHPEDNPADE